MKRIRPMEVAMRALENPDVPLRTQPAPGGATVSALPGRAHHDAALVARVRDDKDRSALKELATHYGPRLKTWLVNRGEISATAEDIVQDVLVTVWTKAQLFDADKASFSTWVFRLTRNRWIDANRKNGRTRPTSPEIMNQLADDIVPAADKNYDQREAFEAVRRELAILSPEQKNILHLAFFEGLTHSEISARTGLPLGTVKSRIRTQLKKLQTPLADYAGVNS